MLHVYLENDAYLPSIQENQRSYRIGSHYVDENLEQDRIKFCAPPLHHHHQNFISRKSLLAIRPFCSQGIKKITDFNNLAEEVNVFLAFVSRITAKVLLDMVFHSHIDRS